MVAKENLKSSDYYIRTSVRLLLLAFLTIKKYFIGYKYQKGENTMAKNKLPSGNLRKKVFIGYKEVDGVRKPVYKSVTGANKADLDEKVETVKQLYKSGYTVKSQSLAHAIDIYIQRYENILSPATIRGYKTIRKFAFQNIMDMDIFDLTEQIISLAVVSECSRINEKTGKVLSAKTIHNEYGLLAAVLKEYNLEFHPKLPKVVKKQNDISTPDVIFNIVKGTEMELPVLLSMWLSFTISEIKGLTKSKSISADGKYISIVEVQVLNDKNEMVSKDIAKNPKRNRTLRLPEYIKKLIDDVDGDIIVPMSRGMLYHNFTRLLEKNGLPKMTFHDLRHVNASTMSALQIPLKQAQDRGGWSTPNIMLSTYTQAFSAERKQADDKIDDYFNNIVGSEKPDERYELWLKLYGKVDNSENRGIYEKWKVENPL